MYSLPRNVHTVSKVHVPPVSSPRLQAVGSREVGRAATITHATFFTAAQKISSVSQWQWHFAASLPPSKSSQRRDGLSMKLAEKHTYGILVCRQNVFDTSVKTIMKPLSQAF